MKKKSVNIITLGCSKNLVDSEMLIKQFEAAGFLVEHDSPNPKGEIVVINTCGFIGDAKEESIDTILNFAEARKNGDIDKLYVMGCLSELYFKQLNAEIPEVDHFYGKFDWKELLADLGHEYRTDLQYERRLTTPSHYAYLKIAEGCNRNCSYCVIPIITGKYQSRPIASLVDETRRLAAKGVKELQIIAQDLSYYGSDIYRKRSLAKLVERLSEVDGIEWIRLHYAYPAGFPMDVLDVMAQNSKVCNYLDIALQHISDPILKAMQRKFTTARTYDLINQIRDKVPEIHLRTTLITGYPNETEIDFFRLMRFVENMRFERLGVFPYSHEEGTYAWKHQTDNVPDEVKQLRADAVMELQSRISYEINEQKVGSILKTIIDRKEGEYYIGRTEYDSPDVDTEVLITSTKKLITGNFYNVKITSADDYDLFGSC
ncbi:MAG: 30S ribosomal protein S12 methylthiotransferase RimO [Cytophagaceae bacterium]|nr:30S ribosomal protein S12 methylthiotransferase RimO [Cytophagaceae bacterium]